MALTARKASAGVGVRSPVPPSFDRTVEDAFGELGIDLPVRGSEQAEALALAAMCRRLLGGSLATRDPTGRAHRVITHGGVAEAAGRVNLDDDYDRHDDARESEPAPELDEAPRGGEADPRATACPRSQRPGDRRPRSSLGGAGRRHDQGADPRDRCGAASTVPQKHVADLARTLAGGRLVTIEAGHLVHATQPEAFLHALRAFLDAEHRASASG